MFVKNAEQIQLHMDREKSIQMLKSAVIVGWPSQAIDKYSYFWKLNFLIWLQRRSSGVVRYSLRIMDMLTRS